MTGPGEGMVPAVARAVVGADAWEQAARLQQRGPVRHEDLCGLARELVGTLRALDDLTQVLGPQVAGYAEGQRAAGLVVYDDTRRVDPHDRLAEAVADLDAARLALEVAGRAGNAFWSAISHIGTETPR